MEGGVGSAVRGRGWASRAATGGSLAAVYATRLRSRTQARVGSPSEALARGHVRDTRVAAYKARVVDETVASTGRTVRRHRAPQRRQRTAMSEDALARVMALAARRDGIVLYQE